MDKMKETLLEAIDAIINDKQDIELKVEFKNGHIIDVSIRLKDKVKLAPSENFGGWPR